MEELKFQIMQYIVSGQVVKAYDMLPNYSAVKNRCMNLAERIKTIDEQLPDVPFIKLNLLQQDKFRRSQKMKQVVLCDIRGWAKTGLKKILVSELSHLVGMRNKILFGIIEPDGSAMVITEKGGIAFIYEGHFSILKK